MESFHNNSFLYMTGFFLFLTFIAYLYFRKAESTLKWKKTKGEVLESDIHSIEGKYGGVDNMFEPRILYRYSVKKKKYHSEKLSYAQETSYSYKKLEKLMQRYAPGKMVIVHYNPADPEESVLFAGARHYNYLYIVFLLFLAVLTFIMGVQESQKKSRPESSNSITTTRTVLDNKIEDDGKQYYREGNSYLQKGKYELALEKYFEYIKDNPEDIKTLENIAWSYLQLKKHQLSLNYYLKVIELDPGNGRVYHNIAGIYFYMDKTELGKKNLELACYYEYKDACMMIDRINKYNEQN